MVRFYVSIVLIALNTAQWAGAQEVRVERVIDGGTFELTDGRIVELAGIRAPGVDADDCPVVEEPRSDEERSALERIATDHARTWFEGITVRLEGEGHSRDIMPIDTLSAYLFIVERGRRLFMINELMIADGFAQACLGQPLRYRTKFLMSQKNARARHLGLWNPEGAHQFPGAGTKRDIGCHSFDSYDEALAFFENEGGPEFDPFLLDTDRDGIPCERLLE